MRFVVLGLSPAKSHFEAYGALARDGHSPTIQSGRYAGQAEAERNILPDLEPKLALAASHRLLEIGCGPGNLLIPLSRRVAHATGVDHPAVIERARARAEGARVQFVAGFFPDVDLRGEFDRVLVYGVIHILPDWPTLERFVDAAAAMVAPRGRLLIGDVPNADRKKRFLASDEGKRFDAEWKRGMAAAAKPAGPDPFAVFTGAPALGTLDDHAVQGLLERYRARGFTGRVLAQHPNLPFGHTREDLLLERA